MSFIPVFQLSQYGGANFYSGPLVPQFSISMNVRSDKNKEWQVRYFYLQSPEATNLSAILKYCLLPKFYGQTGALVPA